jgi:hypothetical protein
VVASAEPKARDYLDRPGWNLARIGGGLNRDNLERSGSDWLP